MNKTYRPAYFTLVMGVGTICVIALIAFAQANGVFIGWVMLLFAGLYILSYVWGFIKYRLTNDCIQQITWGGKVMGEVYYTEIKQAFLHKEIGNITRSRLARSDMEYLLFVLNDGSSIRFDTTSIDDSEELFAALKNKIETL